LNSYYYSFKNSFHKYFNLKQQDETQNRLE